MTQELNPGLRQVPEHMPVRAHSPRAALGARPSRVRPSRRGEDARRPLSPGRRDWADAGGPQGAVEGREGRWIPDAGVCGAGRGGDRGGGRAASLAAGGRGARCWAQVTLGGGPSWAPSLGCHGGEPALCGTHLRPGVRTAPLPAATAQGRPPGQVTLHFAWAAPWN